MKLSPVFKERVMIPILYCGDSNLVFFRHHYNRSWITVYDAKTNNIGGRFRITTALKQAGNDGKPLLTQFSHQGKLIVITEDFSRRNDELKLFFTILDKQGKVLTPTTEFFNTTTRLRSRADIKINKEKNYFILESKVVIDRNDEEELTVAKYDNNFKQLSLIRVNTKDIHQEKEGDMLKPLFGYSDSLYMLNFFEEERAKRGLKPVTSVYAYTSSGRLLFSQVLNSDSIALTGYKLLSIGKEKRLVTYYSDDNTYGVDGSLVFIYSDKQNKFILKERNKIPKDVKAVFTSLRKAKRDKSIAKFGFSDNAVNDKNEHICINEQIHTYMIMTNDGKGRGTSQIMYETGADLLVEKFDSSGKLMYYKTIHTPVLKNGVFPKQRFKIAQNQKEIGVFFLASANEIPSSMRSSMKNFNKDRGVNIFTYDLGNKSDNRWALAKIPLKSGFKTHIVEHIEGTNTVFICADKRPPKLFAVFWNIFGGKYKTQIGLVDVKI